MRFDEWDEDAGDVSIFQALVCGLYVALIAAAVGTGLYFTMQAWFWLERTL